MAVPELTLDAPQPFIDALDALSVEERLEEMGKLDEEDRTRFIEELPVDTRMKWINEEREHLESIGARQVEEHGVEGAEVGEAVEEVTLPGAESPQDRAPDVGAETIAQLVNERMAAERRAAAAERELAAAAAELDAYYKAFGPLPT